MILFNSGMVPPRDANLRALSRSISALSASRINTVFSATPVNSWATRTRSSSSEIVVLMGTPAPIIASNDVSMRAFQESLPRNPAIYPRFQHVQRQTAAAEYFVVKCADIEARTQALLGPLPQFANFKLPDLVAERLRRPRNVTIDLGLNRGLVGGAAFPEVRHSLLAAPALGMNPRIDHQANRAHQLL